ncbi:MAG TPA: M23 family metallopeptidase [Candidatus Dormibacteraeota bacterium]|jgi:murein DD-endopeptidase MepM/ murein hydrolase activator NlpD
MSRIATHGWVLALTLLVSALAPLGLNRAQPEVTAIAGGSPLPVRAGLLKGGPDGPAPRAPSSAPQTGQLPALREYAVQAGDTLGGVARQAAIGVDTLIQVNGLSPSQELAPGQIIILPPVDGTMIAVGPGQTLAQLARAYRADAAAIRTVNGLTIGSAVPAQIFIPAIETGDLAPPDPPNGPTESLHHLARFVWPAHGIITTYFWQYHPGIDIANEVGTPEVAADAGRVIVAGWGSYGIYVEIDHGNGFHTVYGHMSRVLVQVGDVVSPGQEIGLMGSTGRSTGPHLHFEIRYNGVPQNPLDFLS